MKAVVLAAGKGSRLRPLTDDTPKAMVTVAGRPLVEHGLDRLVGLGVDELVFVVGYRKEQVIDRFGDAYRDVPITYVHQRELRGLAHALLRAEPHVDRDFLLLLADNVFQADLQPVVDRHRSGDADATLLVEEVPPEQASRYGVCRLDATGAIAEIVEKPDDPPSNLVLTGFYAFSPAVFLACRLVQPSARGEYELSDAIDLLVRAGRTVVPARMDGWRVDVGFPEDRRLAERRLRETTEPEPPNR